MAAHTTAVWFDASRAAVFVARMERKGRPGLPAGKRSRISQGLNPGYEAALLQEIRT